MNTALRRRCLVFVATITITMSWWAPARATPGDLDATFGGGGIVTTRVTPRETSGANAVAIQADGKIVAARRDAGSNGERFAIVRYNVDGHLDGTFGHDGRVRTSFAARRCVVADAVAIQPDGKIVAAGIQGCRGSFALARYLPNGKLDPSFGGDGKVVTRFRSGKRYSESFSVVIQPDGRIVAGGSCCGSRLLRSGSIPSERQARRELRRRREGDDRPHIQRPTSRTTSPSKGMARSWQPVLLRKMGMPHGSPWSAIGRTATSTRPSDRTARSRRDLPTACPKRMRSPCRPTARSSPLDRPGASTSSP